LLNLCALFCQLVGLIRHPAINRTMPDNRGATVLDDLPELIIVCARLPPKDALRCRAVHKSWRTRDFLLADHHASIALFRTVLLDLKRAGTCTLFLQVARGVCSP
jgi:hypothetical protein